MTVEIKHIKWLSTAGYPQERWDVIRDDGMELGGIQYFERHNKYLAMNYKTFKSKYFVRFNSAVKFLERLSKNTIPITSLGSVLYQ